MKTMRLLLSLESLARTVEESRRKYNELKEVLK